MGDDILTVMINGMVIAQVQQTSQTEAGKVLAVKLGACLRYCRQFCIGRRQHDDITRRLTQIDGVGSVIDGAGFGSEKMHKREAL